MHGRPHRQRSRPAVVDPDNPCPGTIRCGGLGRSPICDHRYTQAGRISITSRLGPANKRLRNSRATRATRTAAPRPHLSQKNPSRNLRSNRRAAGGFGPVRA